MNRVFITIIFLAFGLSACLPDLPDSEITKINKEQAKIIDSYLEKNSLTAKKEELYNINGDYFPVYTMIQNEGIGKGSYINNESAWISYTISDLQGRVIETIKPEDSLMVYPGGYSGKVLGLSWSANMFLGVGGKGTFIIPSSIGYGRRPPSGVENDAILILNMEVLGRFNESEQIAWFIKKNKITDITTTDSGLMISKIVEVPDDLETGSSSTVKYKGKYMNDYVFDKSDEPIFFDLNNTVPGFAEAVKMMQVGEKAIAILPSKIAYGEDGNVNSGIAPHMAMCFEIEAF